MKSKAVFIILFLLVIDFSSAGNEINISIIANVLEDTRPMELVPYSIYESKSVQARKLAPYIIMVVLALISFVLLWFKKLRFAKTL